MPPPTNEDDELRSDVSVCSSVSELEFDFPIARALSCCLMQSPEVNALHVSDELAAAMAGEDKEVNRFEGPRARAAAVALWLGAVFAVGLSALYYSTTWLERALVVVFYTSSFTLPHFWVQRERCWYNTVGLAVNMALMAGQPHMDVGRQHGIVGAVHGSASVFHCLRAVQFYCSNDGRFAHWKPWRRMYFVSAWGWHDVRLAKFVGTTNDDDDDNNGKDASQLLLWREVWQVGKWLTGMITLALALHFLGTPHQHRDLYASFFAGYLVLRWTLGFFLLLAWFNFMDALPRAVHLWADQHELRHISQDPWVSRTVKEFWRRWDLPVQDLLVVGVYHPVSRRVEWMGPAWKKLIAKTAVFFVSAVGHCYAIYCGGLPKAYLVAMFSFFMAQLPLLLAEEVFQLSGAAWVLAAEVPLVPLFIEPCLAFVGL